MSSEPFDPDAAVDPSLLSEVDLETGDLVVYDPDNSAAWLQSDASVDLADYE
ncbi:MAG: hypothetical protein ABEJ06_02040 [Haloarculaceae archaeon]